MLESIGYSFLRQSPCSDGKAMQDRCQSPSPCTNEINPKNSECAFISPVRQPSPERNNASIIQLLAFRWTGGAPAGRGPALFSPGAPLAGVSALPGGCRAFALLRVTFCAIDPRPGAAPGMTDRASCGGPGLRAPRYCPKTALFRVTPN